MDLVRTALLEYARLQPGGIVLVQRPRLEPTSCFSPASEVRTGSGTTSTAGLLIEASPDELLVTAASHAVGDDDVVEVAGVSATVVGRHEGTDSCVLRVSYSMDCPLYEKASRLKHHAVQHLPPRAHEEASFDGAASGLVHTRIRAHDPSVILNVPGFASKIYTDNDTREGDSGAALYDSSENAIGFAAYRTAYGDDPSYAIWIWAKQVLDLHNLGGI